MNIFFRLKGFFEAINQQRDRFLFVFIKKYWPRWFLPNHLTIFRMILAVWIIYLLLSGFENGPALFGIFVFGALLDLFDGSVARALKKETKIGAFLDPTADRMLIIPVAIFIMIQQDFWLLLALVGLELINGILILIFKKVKAIQKANIFGKVKMVLECFAFAIAILFDFPNAPSLFPLILLYLAVLMVLLDMASKIITVKSWQPQ